MHLPKNLNTKVHAHVHRLEDVNSVVISSDVRIIMGICSYTVLIRSLTTESVSTNHLAVDPASHDQTSYLPSPAKYI